MPHYLIQAAYTTEALQALVNSQQNRTEVVRAAIEHMGGKLVGNWASFGDYDTIVLLEMPSNVDAAALAIAVAAGGSCKAVKTHAAAVYGGSARGDQASRRQWLQARGCGGSGQVVRHQEQQRGQFHKAHRASGGAPGAAGCPAYFWNCLGDVKESQTLAPRLHRTEANTGKVRHSRDVTSPQGEMGLPGRSFHGIGDRGRTCGV